MSDVFHALAAPARRAILDELQERDRQTLFELCTRLTMKHGLEMFVGTEREGRYKFHHLDKGPLRAIADRWPVDEPGGARPWEGSGITGFERRRPMKIVLTSVYVDDQARALDFYTRVLGFVKKEDVPMGEHRWLTVVSPEAPNGTELVLEPDGHPAARPFKDALVADGIPFTAFGVEDVEGEYERLKGLVSCHP